MNLEFIYKFSHFKMKKRGKKGRKKKKQTFQN